MRSFPAKPRGMDSAFYRELQAWARDLQRDAEPSRFPNPPFQIFPTQGEPFRTSLYAMASSVTFNQEEMNGWHYIECTVASNLTLPAPAEGMWVGVWNYGTKTISLKNPAATTIARLAPNQYAAPVVLTDGSGVPLWPSGVLVYGVSGRVYVPSDVVYRGGYPVVIDTVSGNYIELRTAAAVMSNNDTGATEPS